MLINGNADDKLPRSHLEKIFKDALDSIKEQCQKRFNSHGNISLKGNSYLGTCKVTLINEEAEKPILVLAPGLWRGESPQWNIHCEVFEKDIVEIVAEELKTKIINQLKVPVGLNIVERLNRNK